MSPWISLAEVLFFYTGILFVMWGGEAWRPTLLLAAFILICICFLSNKYHGDTKERIGLSVGNTGKSLKLLIPWALPLLFILFAMGWKNRYDTDWDLWFSWIGYPIWGFAQEYVLLGFMANRLEDGLPGRQHLIPWINGALFAGAHWPNPVLMVITFIAGVLFTHVYFRQRNLYAPALVHALFGIAISLAFANIYGIMSVGPGYEKRLGNRL